MAQTTVTIDADLGELRRELAKLPNLGTEAAQKTLIEVEKAVHKAEKAAKKASKQIAAANKAAAKQAQAAGKSTEGALKDIGETAGDTESSLRAISGALGMISPEAEAAMNVVAELGGGLEGVTKGTGLLGGGMAAMGAATAAAAAVAAAAYVAWKAYNVEAERAAFLAEAVAAAELARTPILADLASSVRAMKVITGELTEEQAALETQAVATFIALNRAIDPTAQKIKDLEDKQRGWGTVLVDTLEAGAVGAGALGAPLRLLTTNSRELDAQINILHESQRGVIATQKKASKASRDLTEAQFKQKDSAKSSAAATRAATQAIRDKAAADRDAKAAALASIAAEKARVVLQEQAADLVSGLTAHRLTEIESLAVAEAASLSTLVENEESTQAQLQAIREEYATRREELEEGQRAARAAAADKEDAAAVAAAKKAQADLEDDFQLRMDIASSFTESFGDLASLLAERAEANGEKMTLDQKRQAKNAHNIAKAAAMGGILIDTALATIKAAAMFGPPPSPVGIAAMAAAGIAGVAAGASVLAVPAPTFHTGGVIQAAKPGEVGITAQAGEAVLSREMVAANGGPDQVMDRAASGMGGGSVTVDFKLRHRSLDQITSEVFRAGGKTSGATRSLRPSGYSNPYSRS